MDLDVVDSSNKKVGTLALSDELFGKRVKTDLIWEGVVHEQAAARRGTHKAKTRSEVQGSGKKLWKQKGTGRARVSDVRNPLWRKGGIVFGPTPRDYSFSLPKKVAKGALREALAFKAQAGALRVVDALSIANAKTKAAVAMLKGLGATGKTLVLDLAVDPTLDLSTRNITGLSYIAANRVSARSVMDAKTIIATKAALERLQEALR
ncbi:MAG: 50S ribosomal protein L4 [Vicinamibacteraceae bacterium]